MTTDQFIEFFSELCSKLLPIIGVIVLIYVILLLRKIIQFFVSMQKTMITVDSTVSVVEEQIRKLDAPLNTVTEFSQTLDNLHEMSQNAVKSALLALISNLNVIRDWLLNHGGVDESENSLQNQHQLLKKVRTKGGQTYGRA